MSVKDFDGTNVGAGNPYDMTYTESTIPGVIVDSVNRARIAKLFGGSFAFAFHSAVARQDADNWPTGGWMSEQRMTRDEALKSMTIWPAFAGFQEASMGSLSPGKLADFVVLDRDIMTVAERDILGTSVLATYIGGRAVYQKQ